MYLKKLTIFFFLSFISFSFSQNIILSEKDATVWAKEQNISGKLQNFFEPDVNIYYNGQSVNAAVSASDSSFSALIIIGEGLTNISVSADTINSDTIKFLLGYNIRPDLFAYAEVNGRDVNLKGTVIENPDTSTLTFLWEEDPDNPSVVSIKNPNDTSAFFSISQGAALGEYYFNLYTFSSKGDTAKSRTFITVDSSQVKPFNIKTDHAGWIDKAVIYEITPYNFTENGKYDLIKTKLPDIADLGITAIWLQPVYSTHNGGQGYDVTNYFQLRNDLGTEEQLRELIQRAKAYGLKVIFDFVANHSSIYHPYAKNSKDFGEASHYYNFYQREEDNAPYSENYHHYQGFINYFWDELPNLNYNNPEVQKWITEAAKYWIEKYDIDGYRFDAIWGVNARNPQFTKDLRLALKRIKPEVLLLAEDKATWPSVFDERFDVAYDWAPEESWVSHWVWQYDYDANGNPTIFNSGGVNNRASMLRNSLTNNGNGYAPNAKILRFMENNDIFHFITHHNLAQTKMVASLMFSLNGVPLIYNGQEIGKTGHPYSIDATFQTGQSIQSQDQYGLYNYYKRLTELRSTLPALRSDNFSEVNVSPDKYIYSYRRWTDNQNVYGIINMSGVSTNIDVSFPINEMHLDSAKTYYLTDIVGGETFSGKPVDFASKDLSIDGYTTRLFLFADTIMTVTGINDFADLQNSPKLFKLEQNYPNPFNPATTISFYLPQNGKVDLKVYDALGREAAVLLDDYKDAGIHSVKFNGSNLASGIYFYRLNFRDYSSVKKMILLK